MDWLKPFRRAKTPRAPLSASYDVAAPDPQNAAHWANADGQSADAAADPYTRRLIRDRARYELSQNNSIGLGIVRTLTEDCIGTGPRLQLATKNVKQNQAVEAEFKSWSQATRLTQKLQTLKNAKTIDGEALAQIFTNDRLPHSVKLDFQPIEADRLEAPYARPDSATYIQGIHLDEFGNHVAYDILKEHPGSDYAGYGAAALDATTFGREFIIHMYRADRPEQHRGVCELAPSLRLFAELRRYTRAVVLAAESGANNALAVSTNLPISSEVFGPDVDTDSVNAHMWQQQTVGPNQFVTLPHGWTLDSFKPEQPTNTYKEFKRELLSEMARAISMPYGIAAADSSDYSYSGGRLDHQIYDRTLKTEQNRIGTEILDRLLSVWLLEASLLGIIPAVMAENVQDLDAEFGPEGIALKFPHSWNWDRRPHVDPSKEASAKQTNLANGTTSRRLEAQKNGDDIDELDEQNANDYGYPNVKEYRQAIAAQMFGAHPDPPEPPPPAALPAPAELPEDEAPPNPPADQPADEPAAQPATPAPEPQPA